MNDKIDVKYIREQFREEYGYIHAEDVDDSVFQEAADNMNNGMKLSQTLDLLQDHIMSQGLCDYTE